MIWAVIMAGGQGTRFWPLSTLERPKQLLPLVTHRTLLEETAARFAGLVPPSRILVVTNEKQAGEVKRLLPKVPKSNILAEPCGRNTAPCIGLAALAIQKRDPEGMMVIVPADQMISRRNAFLRTIRKAVQLASRPGTHVTIGIKPTFAATGFGWIESGTRISGDVRISGKAFKVKRFIEKPALLRAKKMLRSKQFSWNSGIFIWKAETVLNSMKRFLPDIHRGLLRIAPSVGTAKFVRTLKREFPKLRAISVDYGIMEKTKNGIVIRADIGFSDVGSWDTASVFWPKDMCGNAVRGKFLAIDSQDNIVFNEAKTPVACIGVEGLTIISTPDGVLVCNSERSQDVKHIQSFIKRK